MSKQYEAAITVLREFAGRAYENASARESCEAAIRVLRVLEDWPKWEPLIKAAGKVDKGALTTFGASSVLDDILVEMTIAFPEDRQRFVARYTRGERDFRALLKALPDKEEK